MLRMRGRSLSQSALRYTDRGVLGSSRALHVTAVAAERKVLSLSRTVAPPVFIPFRTFFFGGDGDGKDGKDGKDGRDGTDGKDGKSIKGNRSDEAEKDEPQVVEIVHPGEDQDPSDAANDAVVKGDNVPSLPHVIALPVTRRPLFPGLVLPLAVTDPEIVAGLQQAINSGSPYVGVFLRRDSSIVTDGGDSNEGFSTGQQQETASETGIITDLDEIYSVGSFAQIHNLAPLSGSVGAQLMLLAHRRLSATSILEQGPPLRLCVDHLHNQPHDPNSDMIKAYCNEIMSVLREVVQLNPLFKEHMQYFAQRVDVTDPHKLADFAASVTTAGATELQKVLEEQDIEKRLNYALELLTKERELSKLQQDISKQVEEKISDNQRKYFLTEQLKQIKKELGLEKDDKEALVQKYRQRLEDLDNTDPVDPSEDEGGAGEEGERKWTAGTGVPAEVRRQIEEELNKLEALEKNSSEFNVTRNYLEWLTSLPWGRASHENFNLGDARSILDKDHYGMDEVKDRILEFIAVGKLRSGVQGKILLFVGPPGVGKTSIGSSIARSLNREFYRFSVGGLHDVAEIKGHRRTYVGAMPGKMIQCLKSVQSENPLVLIDEVDKMGRGHTGDPASALLELLDPSQNHAFTDHYLDVPVDMSKVLFVCTANVIDTIPGPLLDRMEVVRLSGYDAPEKVEIAQRYLIPTALKGAGLVPDDDEYEDKDKDGEKEQKAAVTVPSANNVGISREAVETLVKQYCREAGVRSLQKHVEKIMRKVALEVVEVAEGIIKDDGGSGWFGSSSSSIKKSVGVSKGGKASLTGDDWCVQEGHLQHYVGKPRFDTDRLYDQVEPGVVMGLAWTAMGGSTLFIETGVTAKREYDPHADDNSGGAGSYSGGTIRSTGQMGSVMEESVKIAHTYARKKLTNYRSDIDFLSNNDIHIHVPDGATPKDGPSAGCTMVTAILSLAMSMAVRNDMAMTGEVSLTGKVLPVGGIKEKTIAARRAGVGCIVMPAANKTDFDELPDYLKEGLEVHFATTYDDVFDVAFNEDRFFD